MNAWLRRGLVVAPPEQHPWWRRCAGIPTCLPLNERLWRLWFAGRDAQGRAGVLRADVDPGDHMRLLAVDEVPGMERRAANAFDSAGLWPSAALQRGGRVYLWYTGMRLARAVPHELAIGLAVSDDGGLTFTKAGDAPVLEAAAGLPRFVTTPSVRECAEGLEMWYSQGIDWRPRDGRLEPRYDLHRATSRDGVRWQPSPGPVLGLDHPRWAGLTRPWVEDVDGRSILWFSARGGETFRTAGADAYRIYHAPMRGHTVDAAKAREVVFAPPAVPGEWDDWMQACPCIVPYGDTRVMFYNGNDFSAQGFGYAVQPLRAQP